MVSPATDITPPYSSLLTEKETLFGLSREELLELVIGLKQPPYRARQIFQYMYARGGTSFQNLSSLPLALRQELDGRFCIERPIIAESEQSSDGTRKWLLQLADGARVETVYIPEEDRGTLCLSSQVGCTLNCRFCHTGTQLFVRNLSASEILQQVACARDALDDWQTPEKRKISNIVMMGMGEPLYNFEQVAKALTIMMDAEAFCFSRRKITLSTAGVVPKIHLVGEQLGVQLAVSLHASDDALRDTLVPLNRKYPLTELMQACRAYPRLKNAERITFEYVMLEDINDSPQQARDLVQLVRGIPAKINLIPFNPWPSAPYRCSSPERMRDFADIVRKAGYAAPLRKPRGRDIMAACGQLKTASLRQHKSKGRERDEKTEQRIEKEGAALV